MERQGLRFGEPCPSRCDGCAHSKLTANSYRVKSLGFVTHAPHPRPLSPKGRGEQCHFSTFSFTFSTIAVSTESLITFSAWASKFSSTRCRIAGR
jgi:hypothetical protein